MKVQITLIGYIYNEIARSIIRTNNNNSEYLLTAHTYSAEKTRLTETSAPNRFTTLVCSQVNNMFSTTSTYGNAKLTYLIGLIILDEVDLAGEKYNANNKNYYLKINGKIIIIF